MAIYHLSINERETGAGKPACQYILREGKYADEQRYGAALVKGSGGLPTWAPTPQAYFGAADKYEQAGKMRGNKAKAAKAKAEAEGKPYDGTGTAIAGYSMDIALPAELSAEQRLACVQDFLAQLTASPYGQLPHAWAVHAPDPGGDERNHHAHIIIGTRPDDHVPRPHPSGHFGHAARGADKSKGGARKAPGIGSRSWTKQTRQLWQDVANQHLAAAGLDERIDCRSYAAQGIDAVPGEHMGPLATEAQRAQIMAEQAQREADNAAKLVSTMEALAEQAQREANALHNEAADAAKKAEITALEEALAKIVVEFENSPKPRPR